MPLYEYDCGCGHAFSRLVARPGGPTPDCPACGGRPRRRMSTFSVGGRAGPGPSMDQAPRSWEGTHYGDRDTISYWHRALDKRAKLEERYPELATPRSPVLAHEGPYAGQPLTVEDATSGGHGHSHGHGHPHGHAHKPTRPAPDNAGD